MERPSRRENRADEPPIRVVGERRPVTVLFCDLAESTPLSELLDPEDFGELILGYQESAREIVSRFGGTVAQFLGDGVLAYFGSPAAHEDDADRAVMTGLAILESMVDQRQKAKALGADSFEARVGIHTGPVVVGSMDSPHRSDVSLFGSSTNIAARLEGCAAPGSVVVSETTVRLLRGRYSLSDRGTPELKGISRPLRIWEVLAAIESPEARRTVGKVKVIGRTEEIAQLLRVVDLAVAGELQVVLVKGEPGVGKSTLLHSLFDELAERPHRWLEFQCSALASASPLQPVIMGIRRLLGIRRHDSTVVQVAKLETSLTVLGTQAAEVMPFIADLLGIETEARQVLTRISPELRRHHLLDGLIDWAIALARDSLLVLVTEDLQWADPTTLELLGRLEQRAHKVPMAIVATCRQDLPEVWQPQALTQVDVVRLDHAESMQLVSELASGFGLPEASCALLAERGAGVPLFLEELVRSVGEGSDPSGALPESLQSLLLASIDGAGDAKLTAQAASILGREFSTRALAALLEVEDAELEGVLARLNGSGILSAQWSTEGPRFSFRHALIQDAAYASVLKRDRRELHGRVCDLLVERFSGEPEASPALLAHHCLFAGRVFDAARWYTAAGREAIESAALNEAVTHYEAGIEAIQDVDAEPERDRILLTLLILCANAIMGTTGLGGGDLLRHLERATTVAKAIGDIDELTSAMNGIATYWFDQGRLDLTIDLADRILAIADESDSRVSALRGHCTLGVAYLMRGEAARSLEHSMTGISLEEDDDFFTITYGVGHDEGVLARCMASWAHWWLGFPDASLATAKEADQRAQALPSSMTQAMARFALALSHFLRGESSEACDIATSNVALCEELGVPFWCALSRLILGTQRSLLQDPDGLADIDQAFESLLEIGNESASSIGLSMLAESQLALGFPDQALLTAEAGLTAATSAGQGLYEPELVRIKGMAVAGLGNLRESASLLMDSIVLATERGAASFRLKTSLILAGLPIRDETSRFEARESLIEALRAMGDGSETVDQMNARTLLGDPRSQFANPVPQSYTDHLANGRE